MPEQEDVFSDDDLSDDVARPSPAAARRVSRTRQFAAVLRKNYLLQTRAGKAWYTLGASGWVALLLEIVVPGIFFALMCIPKHYLDPVSFPRQLSVPYDLDASRWAVEYEGPAKVHEYRALVLYSPNTTAGQAVMGAFARSIACPEDPSKKSALSTSFYALFRQPLPTEECSRQKACLNNAKCADHLLGSQIVGYATEKEAVERASDAADTVDAVISLQGLEGLKSGQGVVLTDAGYTLRVNHTEIPSTRGRLNVLDVQPDSRFKKYWLFSNLQLHLDRAILGLAMDAEKGQPALLEASFKPFPWPSITFDAGAAAAAVAFNLLLVFAFLVPTRSMVATLVREKELRLREGMRILGLQDAAYWGSWALSHFATLAASMLVCAIISLYPFRHSSFTVLLVVLWLVAAALIAFAYFLTTLFSKSRVAGIAAVMLYALAMVPGYLMPTFQPYGGWGWYLACLFPPSAISLFANVLIKVEAGGQGLQWHSLGQGVTSESSFPFSAKIVLIALITDILLYSLLAAYCDKVIPSDVGANLPWNFLFKKSFWQPTTAHTKSAEGSESAAESFAENPDLAVSIQNLRKVFVTTEGTSKAAVDGLSLQIMQNQITALLGANGAGKTTTISVLTGMLKPSSGDAFINGHSILEEMGVIRQSLGVCPQFDILWPDITVREHLELYAAIKGYSWSAGQSASISAAEEVGLGLKLDSLAGNLSGGQKRKLSVAIAFLGSPSIVILDEPTSGMDPYSKRFTWDIIKRHKAGHAIILTTHSMEEADLLCDRIAIMAEGGLAALGTSMDLKRRFGVGYRLTIVKQRDASHTSSPPRFASMLRELDAHKSELGVSSYGVAETTLEEVFLAVTRQNESAAALPEVELKASEAPRGSAGEVSVPVNEDAESRPFLGSEDASGSSEFEGDLRRPTRVQGLQLYCQQLWALIVKRAISAKRDRMAFWNQLCIPIVLVLVALIAGRATSNFPQEPVLAITRESVEFGAPTVFGASAEAKGSLTALGSFLDAFPASRLVNSHTEKLWKGPFLAPARGTLDGFLLQNWGTSRASYDALFVHNWTDSTQILGLEQPVVFTVLANQTAMHALPAAINAVSSALLRAATGDKNARLSVTNYPLPTLSHERSIEVSRRAGDLLLVLFTIMASALLSASFALFLVRERESCSKDVQMISGAPVSAFWLSTFIWDMLSFSIPAAGIFVCYIGFQIPQFAGARLWAFAMLLWVFGAASLPFSYVLHFAFTDEMKALQRINSAALLCGYLGFLATWILDIIYRFTRKQGVHTADAITTNILRLLSPHFNLARGMYNVAATHTENPEMPDTNPWTWGTTWQWITFMAIQAAVYGAVTLVIEAGWVDAAVFYLRPILRPFGNCFQHLFSRGEAQPQEWPEDEDVAREKYRIQDGRGSRDGDQVILEKLQKGFSQGCRSPPVLAVGGVSVGISQGECFGLLGVNGAGKTTTFRILTGEVKADSGEASICGHSVMTHLPAARRNLGYCPQFSALPGGLTGREVLRMYARLRGVPKGLIEGSIQSLLSRLDLLQYADRSCESYSGGNKRKLSVGVALIGSPPVVMLDEPSTGMDPGAKRFLWDIVQRQVIDRGHTVLLTSHSMEECEALCTKIAIMRSGRLRCLGSVQHLKNRFGAGYALSLRLESALESERANELLRSVCPHVECLPSVDNRMSFRIPQQDLDLPLLFETLEKSRSELGIEEYSVSQTTLEHVFVQLAQQ